MGTNGKGWIPEEGDIVTLDADGGSGRRQALVVSPSRYNKTGDALVVAVTSKIKGYPFEVRLPEGSTALRSVAVSDSVAKLCWRLRNASRIGRSGPQVLMEVRKRLRAVVHSDGKAVDTDARIPREGDIVILDFDEGLAHEQSGRRPALVLSPFEYNRHGQAVVAAITSKIKGYPFEIPIPKDATAVPSVILTDTVVNLAWTAREPSKRGKVDQATLSLARRRLGLALGF